jgi:hypothetical protein
MAKIAFQIRIRSNIVFSRHQLYVLCFLTHKNFPTTISKFSDVIMFYGDTNVLICNNNYDDFKQMFSIMVPRYQLGELLW